MKKVRLNIKVSKPFGNLFRKQSVLIVIETSQNEFLVGAKPQQYPPTITRLIGGGVENNESAEDAAIREICEELGTELEKLRISQLLTIIVSAEDETGKTYKHMVNVFYANIGKADFKPGDDVQALIKMPLSGLYDLGERYEALPETLWYNGPEGFYSWSDYAKLYGPVHKLSYEALKK